jgi:hypothetical protein
MHLKLTTLALALMLVTLWLLMHGYHGLTGDGQIYAFQALSRIHPQLVTDLYLQNTSQDQFTIFSPFYAWFIGLLGLENAARLLTMLFTAWCLVAAWSLARAVTGRDAAWLAVALLLIVAGDYGGSGVFRFSEQFLTARLPGEALVTTALACHVGGMKRVGLLLAMAALFVHPLIALPGLLMMLFMRLPSRVGFGAAIAGVLAVLCIAQAHLLPVIDAAWLEIVRERSQFLFLQLWSVRDWEINTRPFIYLGFTAIAVPNDQLRKVCMAAALVGAAGFAVALIGSLIGPVAILVQGQAWRWIWITAFVSVLLVPVTVMQVWRDEKCGPICALLLVSGCALPAVEGTACVSFALILWVMRTNIDARAAPYFRWLAAAIGGGIVAWILVKSWAIIAPPISPAARDPLAAQIRDIFGLRVPAALVAVAVWWWLRTSRKPWVPVFLCAMLASLSLFILPAAFKQSRTIAAASDIAEFADWTRAIPPTSSVLVVPPRDAGGFVWFTLGRPNYLGVNQSAGVVFSRATAVEVQRRSEVLMPVMDPNWKILTGLRAAAAAGTHKVDAATRPLTARSLIQVCADPQLGYVISPESIGFDPLRHEHAGMWKDWNLYDCRKVRAPAPAT